MVWRVSRSRNDENIARLRKEHALLKWAKCALVESYETRLPPPRPPMRQIALNPSSDPRGSLEFLFRYPKAGVGQIGQATRMIRMEMRQHDLSDVSRADP